MRRSEKQFSISRMMTLLRVDIAMAAVSACACAQPVKLDGSAASGGAISKEGDSVYLTAAMGTTEEIRWEFAEPLAAGTWRLTIDFNGKVGGAKCQNIGFIADRTPVIDCNVNTDHPQSFVLITVVDSAKPETRTLTLVGAQDGTPTLAIFPSGRKHAIFTTWDDGSIMDLTVAEMLKKHGFRGTFFMNRGSEANKHLPELEALGMEIGSHSWNHPAYYPSGYDRCYAESANMRKFLEGTLGHPVISFGYPYGYQPAYDDHLALDAHEHPDRGRREGCNRHDVHGHPAVVAPLSADITLCRESPGRRYRSDLERRETPGYRWSRRPSLVIVGNPNGVAIHGCVLNSVVLFSGRQDDVLAARFGSDFQFNDGTFLDVAFDDGLLGGVEFERCAPVRRPGWEQRDFVTLGLHEHALHGDHKAGRMVLIGSPVVVRAEEAGEAVAGGGGGGAGGNHGLGFIG